MHQTKFHKLFHPKSVSHCLVYKQQVKIRDATALLNLWWYIACFGLLATSFVIIQLNKQMITSSSHAFPCFPPLAAVATTTALDSTSLAQGFGRSFSQTIIDIYYAHIYTLFVRIRI